MFPIASATVGAGGASSIVFNNISQDYTHLQARISGRGTTVFAGGLSVYLGITGVAASAGKRHFIQGNGSSVTSNALDGFGVASVIADGGAGANVFSSSIMDILDWANPNKNISIKCISGYDSNGSGVVTLASGMWVVTSSNASGLTFNTDGNWVAGSRIDIYGLKISSNTGA
jgi:hypothetical protein